MMTLSSHYPCERGYAECLKSLHRLQPDHARQSLLRPSRLLRRAERSRAASLRPISQLGLYLPLLIDSFVVRFDSASHLPFWSVVCVWKGAKLPPKRRTHRELDAHPIALPKVPLGGRALATLLF
ncbi:Hypothetical predicted protein [Podarcis lilfordi]|uniref:Uncharacterized protein n=1 Tax=Podarcis lilfordi TaxID=74358 RepID=A0AA35JNA7_9SAUR|nr:Hypothetical predicted protein [Podarcis lilfordi]